MKNLPWPPTPSQFNLQRWFAVVSLATIAVISTAVAASLSWFMTQQLLLQEAVLTKEFVHSLIRVEQSLQSYLANPSAGLSPQSAEAFRHVAEMPNVLRANVYGLQRRVIWSSDLGLIGRDFGPNAELDKALRGDVVVEFATEERDEHGKQEHEGRGLEDAFVEIYVPVRDVSEQRVLGVIEFYKNPRSLLGSIKQLRLYVAAGAGLSGVLLYVALFGLVQRAARLIQAQQKQLVEKETLAVIGEMSSAVAHGIRNPLASIRSSAEIIPLSDANGVSEAVRDIVAESERLEAWVRELLSYTRPLVEAEAPVAIHELVRRCAQDFEREAQRRGIALQVECPSDLPAARGDAMLFAQVLRSLLTNAIEATARGGHISLRGRRDTDPKTVSLSVEDDGAGMSPADLARAGTPFQTTKPRGLGVGLALARRIVERFGGRLTITSTLGRGTVVRVQLRVA
jgi:two-component system, NtrC family, sensor histidine kinase HydH